jgi:hypothetical protein
MQAKPPHWCTCVLYKRNATMEWLAREQSSAEPETIIIATGIQCDVDLFGLLPNTCSGFVINVMTGVSDVAGQKPKRQHCALQWRRATCCTSHIGAIAIAFLLGNWAMAAYRHVQDGLKMRAQEKGYRRCKCSTRESPDTQLPQNRRTKRSSNSSFSKHMGECITGIAACGKMLVKQVDLAGSRPPHVD